MRVPPYFFFFFLEVGDKKLTVKAVTLQLQVLGLQFQSQQHICLQFGPAGWFCLCGIYSLDLCCKAPSGESPEGRSHRKNIPISGRQVKTFITVLQ